MEPESALRTLTWAAPAAVVRLVAVRAAGRAVRAGRRGSGGGGSRLPPGLLASRRPARPCVGPELRTVGGIPGSPPTAGGRRPGEPGAPSSIRLRAALRQRRRRDQGPAPAAGRRAEAAVPRRARRRWARGAPRDRRVGRAWRRARAGRAGERRVRPVR